MVAAAQTGGMVRRRLTVHGEVQGVGFRWACDHEAERLGVAGWVRNLPDGAVEIVAEGADDAVGALAAWAEHGPPGASVTRVDVSDEPPQGAEGFRIRR